MVYLTRLSIFNDEAIYLDWGLREVSKPRALFYSLYDAKQPLLMWIFGISEKIFSDPLFAGRIVSVCTGLVTMLGIYAIGEKISNKKIAYLASFSYIVIPIFSFFDRQALMESAVAAVGVWGFYVFILSLESKRLSLPLLLGVILGIGFLIKSSSLLFLVVFILFYVIFMFQKKNKEYLKMAIFMIFSFLLVSTVLFVQSQFWSTISSNSRYTFTFSQLLRFPVMIWLANLWTNTQILFFYLSPIVFGLLCLAYFRYKRVSEKIQLVLSISTALILIVTFTEKVASQRYIVSFLPLLTIPTAYMIDSLSSKLTRKRKLLFPFAVFFIPACMVIFEIVLPIQYFLTMNSITGVSDASEYVISWTAGIPVKKAVAYLDHNTDFKSFVGMALNTGNPESSIIIYMEKKNIPVGYLDSRIFNFPIQSADCLTYTGKLYFVSRDAQLAGLDKFLTKVTSFQNPYGSNSVGIYTLIPNCKGKTLRLN